MGKYRSEVTAVVSLLLLNSWLELFLVVSGQFPESSEKHIENGGISP